MRLIDAEKFEVFNATCPITKGIRSGKTAAYFYGEGCRKVLEAIDKDVCCGWISVKDRLPEPHTNVLFFGRYGFFTGWYSDFMRKWRTDECSEVLEVTHWMPLPKPPEEPHD